ncbi:MAG: tetraacyldisaccharide 4'-kinase [Bauldia sp.]
MRSPAFWWRRPGLAALALWPASAAWGRIVARRMNRPPAFVAPVPVICVGNYTGGGEGKTPTALAVAAMLRDMGLHPGFLTRGYGGREASTIVVDKGADPAEVGDEALLLARAGLTVLSGNRPLGAQLLVKVGANAIVMDDGFQNPSLAKDLAMVVTDSNNGLGNRMVMPSGPLRAPLAAQLAHTDVLVVIGRGAAHEGLMRIAARSNRRVLGARLVPVDPPQWDERRVLAYAAIGRPEKFFTALEEAGARLAGRKPFPDHHMMTDAEAATLLSHARGGGVRLMTTEKDMARLAGARGALAELRQRSEVFRIRLDFDEPAAVVRLLGETVEKVRSRRRSGA